ncbi:MAG TPA: hypothetical protein P5556_02970 [Candidatus Gastranaerophilales bacterium]|nr:hypothetical protein [Candidatus Gastranaerophilales bacterium]
MSLTDMAVCLVSFSFLLLRFLFFLNAKRKENEETVSIDCNFRLSISYNI